MKRKPKTLKMDAMSHQGKATLGQLVPKSDATRTTAEIGEPSGESYKTVQRYIRLTNLIPEMLDYVDDGRMSLTPAVELSYLTEPEQRAALEAMTSEDCTPSLPQACRLKKLSQAGQLTPEALAEILCEEKANQKEKLKIPMERIRGFFPRDYTTAQIEDSIVKLCEAAYRKKQRDRDAR